MFEHACATRADNGLVVCWGDDSAGQVRGAPNFVRFAQLASRESPPYRFNPAEVVLCGLREEDQLAQCFGGNNGFGSPTPALPADVRYRAITTQCGVRAEDGRSDCAADVAPDAALSEIDSFAGNTCAIVADDNTARCWGAPGSALERDVPQGVALHGITVGGYHACALRLSDNQIVCWVVTWTARSATRR